MFEIEIKAKVSSHVEIENKVISMGGKFIQKINEDDEYFNHPSRDFKQTHEAFRIRVTDGGAALTYKGPVLPGIAKARVEAETSVGNPETIRNIFVSLGFIPSGRVKKTRKEYTVNNCIVTLDNIEGLGSFVEIERTGEDREALEADVLSLARLFCITEFERRSYLELVLLAGL
jgi:adenylate cyclase, class 2